MVTREEYAIMCELAYEDRISTVNSETATAEFLNKWECLGQSC